ncbi:unnamed protein product [Pleuronectes platessa]|uniref:Uncharacterized protein n=1 Tax=Pleuronectes platessa TaxID=8262 RepID=A0A9N7VT11_PLEPL|nr:unnamed protein product [Pleuronectes platessa]
MLRSTLVAEADAGCFLQEVGHVTGACRIGGGHIVTEKAPTSKSLLGCPRLLSSIDRSLPSLLPTNTITTSSISGLTVSLTPPTVCS